MLGGGIGRRQMLLVKAERHDVRIGRSAAMLHNENFARQWAT
jgi:hypothetical protein